MAQSLPKYILRDGKKFALIINVTKHRDGSERDTEYLSTDLKLCGFQVRRLVEDDEHLSEEGIKQSIVDWKKKLEFVEVDCILIAVMSHGKGGDMFYDSKWNLVDFNSVILNPFSDEHWRKMVDKPKIFLANFCRHPEDKDSEEHVQADESLPYSNVPPRPRDDPTLSLSEAPPDKDSIWYSDVHLCYATIKGCKAWREAGGGAHMVRAFCNTLAEHANGSVSFQDLTVAMQNYLEENFKDKQRLQSVYSGTSKILYLQHKNAPVVVHLEVNMNAPVKETKRKKMIETKVSFLAHLLAQDNDLLERQEEFYTNFPGVSKGDIWPQLTGLRCRNVTVAAWYSTILTKWTSANASCDSTVRALVNILKEAGFRSSAEKMLEQVGIEDAIIIHG